MFALKSETRYCIKIIGRFGEKIAQTVYECKSSVSIVGRALYDKKDELFIINWDETESCIVIVFPFNKYPQKYRRIVDYSYSVNGKTISTIDNKGNLYDWSRTTENLDKKIWEVNKIMDLGDD